MPPVIVMNGNGVLCVPVKKSRDSKFMEITSGDRMKAIYYGPYIATDVKEHLSMWDKRHKIKEYDVALDGNSRSLN